MIAYIVHGNSITISKWAKISAVLYGSNLSKAMSVGTIAEVDFSIFAKRIEEEKTEYDHSVILHKIAIK